MISEKAVEKVESHIKDVLDGGGQIVTGGHRHEMGGTFFEPTVLTGVTQDMKVSTEETFGPVAPLFKFEKEEDAIELANATIFGLASYFYARDVGRITRVQEGLEYGIVGVNTGLISTSFAPNVLVWCNEIQLMLAVTSSNGSNVSKISLALRGIPFPHEKRLTEYQ